MKSLHILITAILLLCTTSAFAKEKGRIIRIEIGSSENIIYLSDKDSPLLTNKLKKDLPKRWKPCGKTELHYTVIYSDKHCFKVAKKEIDETISL